MAVSTHQTFAQRIRSCAAAYAVSNVWDVKDYAKPAEQC